MPWAQFDDHFHDSEGALLAGPEACGLHLLATAWCCAHLSDARLPAVAARPLIERCDNGAALVAQLEAANLWEATEDGYTLLDFWTNGNRTREQVERDRAARKQAGSAGGRAKSRNRPPSNRS
jgi:hypothetical protein